MQVREMGPQALLVEVDSTAEAAALAAWARHADLGATEIVPATCTVLLDGVDDIAGWRDALAGFDATDAPSEGPLVEIPVRYDGQDLPFVAERWGMSDAEVIERHVSTVFTSAFCGFAPGFAYLSGLPDERAVPRLATPRPRIDAGSVGLAGAFCGVYPSASPGGWRIIGHTDVTLWDLTRDQPALLAPGTRVRFVEVDDA